MKPRFLRAGDRAIVIELGDAIDPELNAKVLAIDDALRRLPFAGFVEAVPTYRSLLVFFDPGVCGFKEARRAMQAVVEEAESVDPPKGRTLTVPAVYDGEDLDEVAVLIGGSRDDVVRLHSEVDYLVYLVGFTPGFAYMGMTHEKLDLPRRASPRTRVPAGSVAIAMGQTGIYPSDTPGGWHLLGRAEHRILFDVDRDPPSYFLPGDRVRFAPVDELPELPVNHRSPEEAASPSFEVEASGLWTTVQDLGRPGYQRYGVPISGAADPASLRRANRLVGNDPGAAALECTVDGPRLRCLRPTFASVAGADLGAVIERADLGRWHIPPESTFFLRPGNVLAFEGRQSGARAYISFCGGIDVPPVLGSRSTYVTAGFGGYEGRPLHPGDRLSVVSSDAVSPRPVVGRRRPPEEDAVVRILWGPQEDYFTEETRAGFVRTSYVVGDASDRMGYRLEGPAVRHKRAKQIVSDGMTLGAIQIPPNGLPIVMLADRATTGGYPKIATVVSEDVAKLAQLLPGDRVRFQADEEV